MQRPFFLLRSLFELFLLPGIVQFYVLLCGAVSTICGPRICHDNPVSITVLTVNAFIIIRGLTVETLKWTLKGNDWIEMVDPPWCRLKGFCSNSTGSAPVNFKGQRQKWRRRSFSFTNSAVVSMHHYVLLSAHSLLTLQPLAKNYRSVQKILYN